jgi:hypothetical protein
LAGQVVLPSRPATNRVPGLSRRGKESPARACYRFINRVNTTLSGGHLLPVSKGRECR